MSDDSDKVVFITDESCGRIPIAVRESHMRQARAVAEEIRYASCGAKVVTRGDRKVLVQPGVRILAYLD